MSSELTSMSKDDLLRRISFLANRISRIEAMLQGQPIGTAQISDLAVTNAKINSLNANKVVAATLSAIVALLGDVSVGGSTNTNGVLRVKDSAGADKVVLDKDGIVINTGKIIIKNAAETSVFDASGIISDKQFASGSVTGSNTTRTTNTYVDVTGATLTFSLTRTSRVVIISSSSMSNTDLANGSTAVVSLNIDGVDDVGPLIINPGVAYNSGVLAVTGAVATIQSLGAGSHTIKLRVRTGSTGNGTALAGAPTLSYVILGT